jgi:hypothetical protein
MNNTLTNDEREYLGKIKQMPCSVCNTPGPSDAHHIKQHRQYLCIPLCKDCHQGSFAGIHGQKRAWIARKMDEFDALNITLKRMSESFENF